ARGQVGEVHCCGRLPHPALDVVGGEDHEAQSVNSRVEVRGATTACPRCGTDNQPGAKYCMECGSGLSTSCPDCGHPTAPGQNFCSQCGAPASRCQTSGRKCAAPHSRASASCLASARSGTDTLPVPAVAAPRRDSAEVR